MKKWPTTYLKANILILGILAIIGCIFVLPEMWKGGSEEFPTASTAVSLIVIGLYATTIPFFIALWQALKFLNNLSKGQAFSDSSISNLVHIKYCAAAIAILYFGGLPLLFPIAHADDAPGLILFGALIASIPLTVTVFLHVAESVLRTAQQKMLRGEELGEKPKLQF